MTLPRYALYFVPPPHSALAAFGRAWLGHDSESGRPLTPARLEGIDPDFRAEIAAEPRRYGFHATLKPPFFLAEGIREGELVAAVECFARMTQAVLGPPLVLAAIDQFLALIPSGAEAELARLAAACLRAVDRLRRPASAAETARRQAARLSDRQKTLLARWGYPYVLEEFRFHMTLTRRLVAAERALIEPALAALAAPLAATPLAIADIALCHDVAGAGFSVLARFPLGSA